MKITLESTPDVTTVNGVLCRHWIGPTESGIRCEVFVRAIAVKRELDTTAFEADLLDPPLEIVPLRALLP